jgi:hypothetical protein
LRAARVEQETVSLVLAVAEQVVTEHRLAHPVVEHPQKQFLA